MPRQAAPDLSLPLAAQITLPRGPRSHLATLTDPAILILDLRVHAAFLLLMLATIAAHAADEVYRLGELAPSEASLEITRSTTMPELARLGFQEGRNLALDERAGDPTAMPALARDLLLAKPDAIIAIGPDAISAAAEATKTVPIITFGNDPVQRGFAVSQARPGGNVTGVTILAEELDAKRLDVLHEAVPAARRAAALVLPSLTYRSSLERDMRAAAMNADLELLVFEAAGPDDYSGAFQAMRAAGAQAVVITANALFNRDAEVLARLGLETGLALMCEWAENARSGCLLGYGPNRTELRRRVAYLVARVFQGTPPAELPIETPTHFELAINLKTAKALGLTVPPSLLARADEVIE
jgi:putative ABC transport system substrate-binding protein